MAISKKLSQLASLTTVNGTAVTIAGTLNVPLADSPTFTGTVSGVTKAMVGLPNVEDKNSSTIRSELSHSNVSTALGFTPYNATNPNGYTTNVGTLTAVTATGPIASTGGTTPVISMPAATTAVDGHLTAADWTIFNNKQAAGTYATGTGSAAGTNTGDNAVNSLYSGLVTNATHTGDVTGSTALTLATVNTNVGQFGSTTAIPVVTVNGKGLITAISTTSITVPTAVSQLSNDSSFATTTYVGTAIANLVASSPAALDTLNELAAALGNDASFAATTATNLGLKALKTTTISAGAGLTGGGDLGADRTLALAASGVTAGTYNNVTVDTYGRATSGSNVAYITGYTEVDTLATVTARGSQASASITIGSNGTYAAGSIYSDSNWGMLFRARQASPASKEFMWSTSTDTNLMTLSTAGALNAIGAITGSNLSGTNTGDNPGVTSVAGVTPIVSSGGTTPSISHATSGATAGTYNNVTVDTFGHVTSGSNTAYITGYSETDTLATVTARGATTSTASTFSGGITGAINGMPNDGNGLSGMGVSTTWDARPQGVYDRYSLNWHTGISLSGYPGYGGVRLYASGYPSITTSTLRLEASDAVYTYGVLYNNGNTVLHAANYNSYSPTLTGGGASGTWGINITGSAASASTSTSANWSTYSQVQDTRAAPVLPNQYASHRTTYEFTDQIIGGWHSAITTVGWDSGSYAAWQIIGGATSSTHENWYLRSGIASSWNPLRTILHSGNYNSYSPTLTGGGASGTWGINITGSAGSIPWANVTGGVRTNYDLGFQAPSSSYAGFSFSKSASASGASDAGYLLIRGTSDNFIPYTAEGITLVSDANSLNLFARGSSLVSGGNAWVRMGTGTEETFRLMGNYSYSLNSSRAPIFYDSDNTAYYVDAAGESRLNSLRIFGAANWDAITLSTDGANGYIQGLGDETGLHIRSEYGNVYLADNRGDVRMPMFYDVNDTAYYVDPNSGSNLSSLTVVNTITGSITGTAASETLATVTGRGASTSAAISLSGTLSFAQPVGLSFANGQYIKDNGGGGLAIYSGAAINLTGATSVTGALTVSTTVQTTGKVVIGGTFATTGYNGPTGARLMFSGADTDAESHYFIGTNLENYGGNYNKLDIRWHTGIRMGARPNYGGIRFYDSEDLGTQIFAIGKDGSYAQANHSMRAPIFYDHDDTTYYGDFASTSNLLGLTVTNTITGSVTGTATELLSKYPYNTNVISDANTAFTLSPGVGSTTVAMHASHGLFGGYATTLTMSGYERYGAYQISGNYNATTSALAMRNYNQTAGGWTSWVPLLSSANYNSYSPTLTGGGASGTWGINITGSAATATDSTKVAKTGDTMTGALNISASPSGRTLSLGGDQLDRVIDDSARSSLVINAAYYPHLYINATSNASNTNHGPVFSMSGVLSAGGYRRWGMGIANTDPDCFSWGYYDNNVNPHYGVGGVFGYTGTNSKMWLNTGGSLMTTGDMRAPIFYDSNDTTYYGDFASTSNLYNLQITGASNKYLYINPGNGYEAMVRYNGGAGSGWYAGKRVADQLVSPSDFHFYSEGAGRTVGGITAAGAIVAYGSVDSPKFYSTNRWGSANLSDLSSAPFEGGDFSAGTTAQYVPLTHQSAVYNSGYRTHVSTGTYKDANGWGAGWYMAIGGSDSYPTEAFQLRHGGAIRHTNGYVTIEGDTRSPLFYDSNDTAYYLDAAGTSVFNRISTVRTNNFLYMDNNYGHSIVGAYSASRYQGVFAMGDAYKLPADGTTTGNLYGLAWSHPNAGGVAANLNTHGLLAMENGTWLASLCGSTRARDDMRAPIFYDNNDTAYYVDPNATTRIRKTNLIASGSGWDDGLNLYSSDATNRWNFLVDDGAADSLRIAYNNSEALTINTSRNVIAAVDIRAPIFYDSEDTGYYLSPNSESNLNKLTYAAQQRFSVSYRAPGRSSNTSDQFYWTNTVGWAQEQGNWSNYWKYGFGGFDCWGTNTDHPQGTAYIHAQGIQSGMHAANADGSAAYGWQMVGAGNVSNNRYWARGKWDTTTTAWKEFAMYGGGGTGDLHAAAFYDSNNTAYYLDPNTTGTSLNVAGSIVAAGNVTAYSDIRLKEDIEVITDAIDKVKQITGVTYTRKENGKRQTGVIAQDVLKVLPEAVEGSDDSMYSVAYGNMVGLLIESIKEQQKTIESLTARIAVLEAK